jgi:hypothetical protein
LADAARGLGAEVVTVESFWGFLISADIWPQLHENGSSSGFFKPDYPNEEELDAWEELFDAHNKEDEN